MIADTNIYAHARKTYTSVYHNHYNKKYDRSHCYNYYFLPWCVTDYLVYKNTAFAIVSNSDANPSGCVEPIGQDIRRVRDVHSIL